MINPARIDAGIDPESRILLGLARIQFSMISSSMSLPMKQRNASSGVQTIGSLRTLKLVFTKIGKPVLALNREINAWKRGFVSAWTVCTHAE
jgi:hypothetical protein